LFFSVLFRDAGWMMEARQRLISRGESTTILFIRAGWPDLVEAYLLLPTIAIKVVGREGDFGFGVMLEMESRVARSHPRSSLGVHHSSVYSMSSR
jgi:hypothetical protein